MEIEKLKTQRRALIKKLYKLRKSLPMEDSFDKWFKAQEPLLSEISMLSRKIAQMQEPTYTPLDTIGDHMTLEDFIECVQSGGFIDYDGEGVYATETEQTDIPIRPSWVKQGVWRKDFTHVKWYNK